VVLHLRLAHRHTRAIHPQVQRRRQGLSGRRRLDSDFAIAHARLGINYSTLGESTQARQSTLKAYQLRDRASDVERFFIDTLYDRQVTGNMEREQRTLESWAQTYPRDPTPHGLLAGFATRNTGKYELAIDEADKAIALDPDQAAAYTGKAFSELHLNRLADAEVTIRRATERRLEFPGFFLVRYFIAFLSADGEETRRKAALAREKRFTEDMISHVEALALARSGRLQEARRASAAAVDIAQQSGQRERAAMFEAATSGMGSVLRECCRSPTEGNQGSRARQGPRRGLSRRVRAGPLGRCGSIPGSCRRPGEELS
jgi:tetratricopeptide (TPR) repeat protein